MVVGHRNATIGFTGQTVAATMAICASQQRFAIALFNLSLEPFRDIGRHKKLRQEYVVSAPAQ